MSLISKFPGGIIDENVICDVLKSTSVLSCLSNDIILGIAKKCRVMAFKKGEPVFKYGEPSNWFYIVYDGLVEEYVGYEGNIRIIVKNKKKYDYLGEMAILSGKPCFDTAIAVSPTILIAVPRETFFDVVWNNVCVVKQLAAELVDRLTHKTKLHLANMYLDASGRLALTLISLASSSPKRDVVNVTQSDLAATVGIARQTAAKIIAKWKKEKIITAYRGGIIINDKEALLDIAAGKNI